MILTHAVPALILGHAQCLLINSLASVNSPTWDAFNQSVSGRLFTGQPVLAPCFTSVSGAPQSPDTQECERVVGNQMDAAFISDIFGGYATGNWASCQATGETCVFNTTTGLHPAGDCQQGAVPRKYVEVHTVEDVQRTMEFAHRHRLRLVIKNTGHDYKGRSSAPDALALWTHKYQPAIRLDRSFTPDGCHNPVGGVITFGAGQQFEGIYEFAHAHGYRVVGGMSKTVGAAGGGLRGEGILTTTAGLGVDNVYQFQAVLPNGTYVTANRCQNQDIFFALRGGGGGTFGVIMEMSVAAHAEKSMEVFTMDLPNSDPGNAEKLLAAVVASADRWASEGWGGYILPGGRTEQPSTMVMATALLDHAAAGESVQSLMTLTEEAGMAREANLTSVSGFYEVAKGILDGKLLERSVSSGTVMSSRIIPREAFLGEDKQTRLTSILNDIRLAGQRNDASQMLILMTAPTVYSQNLPASDEPDGPGASSVTPAWRNGLWHVIHVRSFDTVVTGPDVVREVFHDTHQAMNPLREFTPGGGAYQNEADVFEPDPVGAFWGEKNYERLMRIKASLDPGNLLTVHQGVGWDGEDARFGCYPASQ
ncbi:FAD-binding domain-containing protein [Aspergillus campestris IBT 28561]|uniref:FAD-binding domain-containing protein n=1 Tax=Aspergillus campestris (strain IBT 28561) TaxID=1392248 RepID=A0A2I1D431_ASPC2|nr:FAD-binding domain-containing protein [Aspergillus campestris IBT 28561]PKY04641.1 FAD-binding domain-containing protein [Aspergillus campestris IBT 28561]